MLIYDLGGGTFDVSVLTAKGCHFQLKSTAGDTHLGGENFNSRAIDACDRAKRLLSSSEEAPIVIDALAEGIDFQSTITRATFEQLNGDLFCSTLDLVDKAIVDAGLDKFKIHETVLVGGSTRILKIQKLVQQYYFSQRELNKSMNPDEAIVIGAAIQAAFLNGDKSEVLKGLALLEVAPLSLGVSVAGGIMSTAIKRNTTIPVTRVHSFYTSVDNQQSMELKIYEGERVMDKDNRLVGSLILNGIRPALKRQTMIEVTFNV